MAVLLLLPISIIGISFLANTRDKSKLSAKVFIVICTILMIAVMGFRSANSGMDTQNYINLFVKYQNYETFGEIVERANFFENGFFFSESGFYIFTWLMGRIFSHYRFFLLAISTVVGVCVARFAWKNSADLSTALIVFVCLGSMTFCMSGIRQSMAMAICLLSYEYVKRRKPIRFLLVVFIAVLFHKSAMIFLIAYFAYYLKFNWKSFAISGVVLSLVFLFADELSLLYDDMTGEDYSGAESFEGGGLFVILVYVLCIVAAIAFNKRMRYEREETMPFYLSVAGLVIYVLRFTSVQIFERISYYFVFFLMVLLPSTLEQLNPKDKKIISMLFVIFALALFAYRIPNGVFANYELSWN